MRTSPSSMAISVIGAGYLGATHAACVAELGHRVVGIEVDPQRLSLLREGIVPFAEPGLGELLRTHLATGQLRFTADLREAADSADVHFVCVGTPQAPGGGADLSAVHAVIDGLAPYLRPGSVVVGKSTVPVGTAARLAARLTLLAAPGAAPTLAWNPEFLREGHGVEDTLRPSRLVLGVTDPEAERVLRDIYACVIDAGVPVFVTDLETAELAKSAANAFLAMKVSFINAIADLSERSKADVTVLADVIGADPRIGRAFLGAGLGFGGGCLPKDLRALAATADEHGATDVGRLLRAVDAINLATRERIVQAATAMCGRDVVGARIGVLGAAFKPGSDDVRDSPALQVADALHQHGARVRVYDPLANVNARSVHPHLRYVASAEAAARGADLLLHLTEWPEFGALDPVGLRELVRCPRLLDARNTLDLPRWRAAGWQVRAVGRGAWLATEPATDQQAVPVG